MIIRRKEAVTGNSKIYEEELREQEKEKEREQRREQEYAERRARAATAETSVGGEAQPEEASQEEEA
jgi:hypothetical protein